MGDRGNIIIEPDKDCFTAPLFFYTHWSGSEIRETLQRALVRGKGRWSDPNYLARIIFCEMIGSPENLLEETGFGISNVECDNSHDYLTVNMKENTVTQRKPSEKWNGGAKVAEWTFEEFINAKFDDGDGDSGD